VLEAAMSSQGFFWGAIGKNMGDAFYHKD